MDTIGDRISALIRQLKITRLRFGAEVGLSSSAVSKLCQGDNIPSHSTIKSICRTYNVNEKWLTTGEGDMFNAASAEEELAFLMGAALSDDRAPFRRKLLKLILELSPEAINKIEEYARGLLAEEEDEEKD